MLTEAFQDEGQAIAKSFFVSSDVSEKAWSSVRLLSEADDITFWTVIAHHDRLSSVFTNLVTAVDQAHSSASLARRRSIRKEDEHALGVIFIRLATTTAVCTRRHVGVMNLAMRLDKILPLSLIFSISAMLLRRSGPAASVCVSSFFLLNPGYLCRLPLFMMGWYDAINRLATRCKSELQRGRFQRVAGDILPLLEQSFRHVRQLWAALHCSPFLADYVSTTRVLRAMRIVVDVISPLLQHFVMLCKDLNPIRDILSQANSILINSALNVSILLILFHRFDHVAGHRSWVLPKPVEETYAALQEAIERYAIGVPAQLLGSRHVFKNLPSLISTLVPATADDQDTQIGKVILTVLSEEIQGSKDFVELLNRESCRQRYGELLLLELTHQGVRFDELLSRQFLTIHEAEKLGVCEDVIARALSGPLQESANDMVGGAGIESRANTTFVDAPVKLSEDKGPCASASGNPPGDVETSVAMVREVFPQFSVSGIRLALDYYGDVEQFIFDASINNIPPHLVDVLNAASPPPERAVDAPVEDCESAEPAPPQASVTKEDLDDTLRGVDFHLYLGSDLCELLSGGDGEQGEGDANNTMWGTTYAGVVSYRKEDIDIPAANLAFNIDEDLKDKIRMLNELIYEDEPDDTGLDVAAFDANVEDSTDSQSWVDKGAGEPTRDDDVVANSPTSGTRADSLPVTSRKIPNDDYNKKRFHVKQTKERAEFLKKRYADGTAPAVDGANKGPSYTKKKKTERRPLKKRAGDNNALLRAVRKGRLHADF
ncbi:unnamed protein product [Phytomonas sp. EM1]|nr:unnamed protein product [Phytomonas sp. EM1]|eukprot:CCW63308.1 unnamed protein product [Phytomonas sp. isolate EM1]